MSRHEIENHTTKYVFGWDQPLYTYFLQVHQADLMEEEENPVVWLGTNPYEIYELADLVDVAKEHGLTITHDWKSLLYIDRDEGR